MCLYLFVVHNILSQHFLVTHNSHRCPQELEEAANSDPLLKIVLINSFYIHLGTWDSAVTPLSFFVYKCRLNP